MHDWVKLSLATSVLVLMMLIYVVCVVPQANRGPTLVDLRLQHDRVMDRRTLRSPIANAIVEIDIDEDLPRPFGHRRIIGLRSVAAVG